MGTSVSISVQDSEAYDYSTCDNSFGDTPGLYLTGLAIVVAAGDGSELFYRHFESSGNTMLVLLHGFGTQGRYLTGLAQRPSTDAGISVVVPDLRGNGRSTL